MFLIDDLLFAPGQALLGVFREVHKVALEARAEEIDTLRRQLGELFQLLEAGRIGEEECDQRERELLDRLDLLEGAEGDECQDGDEEDGEDGESGDDDGDGEETEEEEFGAGA